MAGVGTPRNSSDIIVDFFANIAQDVVSFVEALLQWRNSHATLQVLINGKEPTGHMIQIPDDQPFTIHVIALDKFGEPATDAGTFQITASNPSLCTIAEDPAHAGDSSYAIGTPTAGSGSFVINVTDGTMTGVSDELDIEPGAPASLGVEINASGPA